MGGGLAAFHIDWAPAIKERGRGQQKCGFGRLFRCTEVVQGSGLQTWGALWLPGSSWLWLGQRWPSACSRTEDACLNGLHRTLDTCASYLSSERTGGLPGRLSRCNLQVHIAGGTRRTRSCASLMRRLNSGGACEGDGIRCLVASS